MVVLVWAVGGTDLLAYARIEPDRPSAGTCETTLEQFASSPRDSIVGCTEPHRAVVLGREEVRPRGQPYPGDEEVQRASTAICDRMWAQHGSTDGRFEVGFVWPGVTTWNDGDDQPKGFNEVVCMVVAVDGAPLPADLPLRLAPPER